MHNYNKTGQTLMDLYYNLQKEKEEIKEKEEFMEETTKQLENKITKLEKDKQQIINSFSWKITKPIRWLKKNMSK